MTSVSSRPLVRLTSPGDIVATIPSLCGFLPQESVVVLSLRGPRKRLGLTVRLDLPPPEVQDEAARLLASRVADDGASAAVVAVYGELRRPELVDLVTAHLGERGVEVSEALHVDAGRWTSYACTGPCCPGEGSQVPAPPALVGAEQALDGRAVLPSRDALVRSLAPPVLLRAQECAQALERGEVERSRRIAAEGAEAVRADDLQQARRLLDAVAHGSSLGTGDAARIAVALHDVRVRDEVATWALKRSDALLALLEQVARACVPPYDAPVCAVLAWVAYARGDGSRVNVGLDRALASDPAYSLALLLRTALDGAVPPQQVRRVLRETKRTLRR